MNGSRHIWEQLTFTERKVGYRRKTEKAGDKMGRDTEIYDYDRF